MSEYAKRFLQELVNDVRVDLDSKEIQEMKEAVNELIGRCKCILETKAPYFKSNEIIPCGSMAEGTRIWKFTDDDISTVMEFDCLAKLQNFKPDTFEASHGCGGFMNILDKSQCLPEIYKNNEELDGSIGKTCTTQVSFNFRMLLMKSVGDLCGCYIMYSETANIKGVEVVRLGKIEKTKQYDEDCDRCKIRKSTGTLLLATGYNNHPVEKNCSMTFLWKRNHDQNTVLPCELTRQKKDINKDVIVLVDFLPAIELYYTEPSSEQVQTTEKVNTEAVGPDLSWRWFLVPKGCKNEHKTCWKVSHCLFEINMMLSTNPVHRQCYMVLKFIFDYLSSDMGQVRGAPTTYVLKTAVLYHIKACLKDKPDLTTCTIEIMKYLSESHKQSYLPHLVLRDQNFLTAPSISKGFRFSEEHKKWSRNRNELLAKFWDFVINCFNSLNDIVVYYNFDRIQTVLKLITNKYGAAYSFTTFKIRHEPDEEEFVAVLAKIARDYNRVSLQEFKDVTKVKGDVDDTWEKSLPDEHVSDAYSLYAQMQHGAPEAISAERVEAIVSAKRLEDSKHK